MLGFIPLVLVTQCYQIHRGKKESGGRQGLKGGGMGVMFNRDGVSVWDDENVLEMDGDDCCTVVWMYPIPLNCVFKNG